MITARLREKSRVLAALVDEWERDRSKFNKDRHWRTERVVLPDDELYVYVDTFADIVAGLVEVIETGAFAREAEFYDQFRRAEMRRRDRCDARGHAHGYNEPCNEESP